MFWGAVQYYYPWLGPVSTQYKSQLPGEHKTHAAMKGAVLLKHLAITSCQVLILRMSEPVATWQHCSCRSLEPATLRLRILHIN